VALCFVSRLVACVAEKWTNRVQVWALHVQRKSTCPPSCYVMLCPWDAHE
jgi:hypothetical protein